MEIKMRAYLRSYFVNLYLNFYHFFLLPFFHYLLYSYFILEKSLSNTNKTCIWNCTQRYIECDHFIKKRSKDSGKLSNINLIDEMNASSFGKINN